MNNEKLGAAPQMYAGGNAKQAIEFAWPNTMHSRLLCNCVPPRVATLCSFLSLSREEESGSLWLDLTTSIWDIEEC